MSSNLRNFDRSPVDPPHDPSASDDAPQLLVVAPEQTDDPVVDELNRCIDDLELEIALQCEGIARMRIQACRDGREIHTLRDATTSARRIGVAIGILMSTRHVSEETAHTLMIQVGQATGQKLRDVADRIVADVT